MSILANKTVSVNEMPTDEIYVIYGLQGSGKTVLASTFPKTQEAPMLYLDFLEGGTGSISLSERDNIKVAAVTCYEDFDEILMDLSQGFTTDEITNTKIPLKYSTIVIDSATQLEFMMKQYLINDPKGSMTLKLWGKAKDSHDLIWNMCRYIHHKSGAIVVTICHQKEITDEENPGNNKIIPSLMSSAAYGLCAKASFVWYTKIESREVINPNTQIAEKVSDFVTYIDAHPAYLSKTRKPKEMKIPLKVSNLTYPKFKKNIIDKITTTK